MLRGRREILIVCIAGGNGRSRHVAQTGPLASSYLSVRCTASTFRLTMIFSLRALPRAHELNVVAPAIITEQNWHVRSLRLHLREQNFHDWVHFDRAPSRRILESGPAENAFTEAARARAHSGPELLRPRRGLRISVVCIAGCHGRPRYCSKPSLVHDYIEHHPLNPGRCVAVTGTV